MTLFYHMPYIDTAELKENAGVNMTLQELVDSADCLYRQHHPLQRVYTYIDGYFCDVFLPNMLIAFPKKVLGGSYGLTVTYRFTNVKMCNVADRKEAFKEISLFMESSHIDSTETLTTKCANGLLIEMLGPTTQNDNHLYHTLDLSFLLADTDNLDEINALNDYFHPYQRGITSSLMPSKPDQYFQRYIDAKSNNDKDVVICH